MGTSLGPKYIPYAYMDPLGNVLGILEALLHVPLSTLVLYWREWGFRVLGLFCHLPYLVR